MVEGDQYLTILNNASFGPVIKNSPGKYPLTSSSFCVTGLFFFSSRQPQSVASSATGNLIHRKNRRNRFPLNFAGTKQCPGGIRQIH